MDSSHRDLETRVMLPIARVTLRKGLIMKMEQIMEISLENAVYFYHSFVNTNLHGFAWLCHILIEKNDILLYKMRY